MCCVTDHVGLDWMVCGCRRNFWMGHWNAKLNRFFDIWSQFDVKGCNVRQHYFGRAARTRNSPRSSLCCLICVSWHLEARTLLSRLDNPICLWVVDGVITCDLADLMALQTVLATDGRSPAAVPVPDVRAYQVPRRHRKMTLVRNYTQVGKMCNCVSCVDMHSVGIFTYHHEFVLSRDIY